MLLRTILLVLCVLSLSVASRLVHLSAGSPALPDELRIRRHRESRSKLGLKFKRLLSSSSPDARPFVVAEDRATSKVKFVERIKAASQKMGLSSLFPRNDAQNRKKLLILMSDTGGGHRASAQALDQAIQEQFPGKIDVEILDIWTRHARWPYNKFVPVYRYLAKHPMLWRGFFAYGTFPLTRRLTEISSCRSSYAAFKEAIERANPDFVVSVHPLCQLMPISIVQEMNHRDRLPQNKPRIPFVTVVTDLGGAHNTWFDPRADAVYVPSEAVRTIALRNKVPAHKVLLKGLPIRPAFWRDTLPKPALRERLGLAPSGKTVLLMGGGDGVGGLEPIATALAQRLRRLKTMATQLVVICGHNQRVAQSLAEKIAGDVTHRVLIKGFVQNIDEFMGAADVLVTKAGPGTIAEAMVRGLPMVLSSFLPGQVSLVLSAAPRCHGCLTAAVTDRRLATCRSL